MKCSKTYDGLESAVKSEFYLEVAKGNIPGHKLKSKFGRNPSVGTSFETIWNGGGTYTGFNAVGAETVTVSSSSSSDSISGTGLRTIRLYGLDANFEEITEDIELDGTADVISTKEFIRMDTAKGLTAGTVGHNVGDVTVHQTVDTAVIFAVIPATYNTTMIAAYTIPAGKTGFLMEQSTALSNKQAASADVRIQIKGPGEVFTVAGEAALNSQGTGYINQSFTIPKQIPEMTDLFIEAEASATIAISAFLEILLVDN